jgi:uncharacterized protein YutE (UPF0331/DUF86 family)
MPALAGPERARVIVVFARSVSAGFVQKRLRKLRKHFEPLVGDDVEFREIERLPRREACEVAFNARAMAGTTEQIERDRLYRYHAFLEWNAGKRMSGDAQDLPPAMLPSLERPFGAVPMGTFITPLYRQLKLMEGYLRDLRRLSDLPLQEFTADSAHRQAAEGAALKAVQGAIIITMSVVHRNMRLAARDYRDLFLRLPAYGMCNRERAARFAKCAEIRDRLIFRYDEVTDVDTHQFAGDVHDGLADFKAFMLEWLFEHYYGPSGELIAHE